MYIVRWLMSHPIMSFYALLLVALVLHFSNGNKEEITNTTTEIIAEQVGSSEDEGAKSEVPVPVVASANTSENEVVRTSKSSSVEMIETQVEKTTEESKSTVLKKATALTESSVSKVKNVASTVVMASSDAVSKVKEVAVESVEKAKSVTSNTTDKLKNATNTVIASATNVVAETKEVVEATVQKVKTAITAKTKKDADNAKLDAKPEVDDVIVAKLSSDVMKGKEQESDQEIEDLDQSTPEEMLLMAREAYWNNGLDEAAQIYKQLIKLEPNIIEHKGELGNVYWRQGYPKKAAELYSEIAIPMVKLGSVERVSNMIGFIGLFYPDRAAEIHKQIQLKK